MLYSFCTPDNRHGFAGLLDLLHADLGQSDVPDFALLLQLRQCAEAFLHGHFGVDAMELVEVDALDLQQSQTHFHLLREVFGPTHGQPPVRPLAREAALCGDDQPIRVWVQRLGDQPFADVGAIGIGRVDEIDAQLDRLT